MIKYKKYLNRHHLWNKIGRYVLEPLNRRFLGTIIKVDTSKKVLALTFDDGPHPHHTPRILEILKKFNAKATFFVLGVNAYRHRNIMAKIAEEGHSIGNHSWSHVSFGVASSSERKKQIALCAHTIKPYGDLIFRPPYGHLNAWSRLDVLKKKHDAIGWNLAAKDWRNYSAEIMFEKIKYDICPGSILLLHDALYTFEHEKFQCRDQTCKLIEMILQNFGNEYSFVNIPDLLRIGKPIKVYWRINPNYKQLSSLQQSNMT